MGAIISAPSKTVCFKDQWVESQWRVEPMESKDWQDWGDVPQRSMEVQDWGDVPESAPDTMENSTDAASVATTLSLGPPWEEETHTWVKQPDGSYQKVPKTPKVEQFYSPQGELLPPTLNDLIPWMVKKGWESRVDVGKFFYNMVPDEKYITRLYKEGFSHPALDDFEKYISEFYEVPRGEWWYGCDLDPIEGVIDLVHFLAIQPKLATDENEKDAGGEIKIDDAVKGDKDPVDSGVRRRHRKKGPELLNHSKKPTEAWTVKWAPLTEKGYLDFLDYCNGQSWPKNSRLDPMPMESQPSLERREGDLVKWRPIRPGEPRYLFESFFCCQVLENMNLPELINYAKTYDAQEGVPDTTPAHVLATIWAISDMWDKYGVDQPDDVAWWLAQESGSQI